MNVIVPLAGPDFVRSDGSIKALTSFSGQPLLTHVLNSRPWAATASSYTFILKDAVETRMFVDLHLRHWYPLATVVFLSAFTRGAACSALAGVACQNDMHTPLIVDLADILYTTNLNVLDRLHGSPCCGGLALTFQSTNPSYSYLRTDDKGKVVEAAEKHVISSHASAGTYIFRNTIVYLKAMAYALADEVNQTYNGLYYVCPLFNGVLLQGMGIEMIGVENVIDIKVEENCHV